MFGLFDRMRGAGDHSVTIPSMDGALKPNNLIDDADEVARAERPGNIVLHMGALHFSSSNKILALADPGVETYRTLGGEIAALASDGAAALAVGLENGGIVVLGGPHDGVFLETTGDRRITCPTAIEFEDPGHLVVALGTQAHAPARWKWDLMERNAQGSVWRVDLRTQKCQKLADKLAFAAGVAFDVNGNVLVTESWRHRVLRLGQSQPVEVLNELPAYVSRLKATSSGYLMAAFAPRRQLVELILREPAFKKRMMEEVPEEHWMAPALSSGRDFLEPLQGGQVRHLGVLKPWAPTKSFGLVVLMNRSLHFTSSLQSRTGGARHGVTSCLMHGERIVYTATGGNVVLSSAVPTGFHHE